MNSALRTLFAALILVSFAGCSTIKEPEKAGFLSDYSKLEEGPEGQPYYSAGKTGQYSRFMVDPVVLLFDPEDSPFTREELQELQEYFHAAVTDRLSENDGYEAYAQPGPGVARIRIGLTEVDKTIGALNLLIWTKVAGAGLGGAAAEGEMVDSVTGEQLVAAIRWGTGSRVLRAGLTKTGDAKIAINKWAKNMRKNIDEAHGKD